MKKASALNVGRRKVKEDDDLVLLDSLKSNVSRIDAKIKSKMDKIRIDGIIKPFVSQVMPKFGSFLSLFRDEDFLVIESMLGEDSMDDILGDEALRNQFAVAIFHKFPNYVDQYKCERAKYLKKVASNSDSNG